MYFGLIMRLGLFRILISTAIIASLLLSGCDGNGIDDPTKNGTVDGMPENNTPPQIDFVTVFELKGVDNAETILAGESIAISVAVTDAEQNLDYVELRIGDRQIGERITQGPFNWSASDFDGLGLGEYTVRIVAVDKNMASSFVEKVITISKNLPPVAEILSPNLGGEIGQGLGLQVVTEASDMDGRVVSGELFFNSVSVGRLTRQPFVWRFPEVPEFEALDQLGTYELKLVVTDDDGSTAEAESSFNVVERDLSAEKELFLTHCAMCHGDVGQGAETAGTIFPLQDVYTKEDDPSAFSSDPEFSYDLTRFISEKMPPIFPYDCRDDCAASISQYVRFQLGKEYEYRLQLVGDAAQGELEYQEHCQSCHGDKGIGGSSERYIAGMKEGVYFRHPVWYTNVDPFTIIQTLMPKGSVEDCNDQCAADVIAYLADVDSTFSEPEKQLAKAYQGRQIYIDMCSGCHGEDGRDGRPNKQIIDLTPEQKAVTDFSRRDVLYIENLERMPPSDPDRCAGECAVNVTLYIREVLDKRGQ